MLVVPPEGSADDIATDTESIKRLLVEADPDRFYLKDSINPDATYKVLWFNLSRKKREPGQKGRSPRKTCKVDILVPGIMHLPALSADQVVVVDDLPLIPYSSLLLQKLQGWDDHRHAEEEHKREKVPVDVKDIRVLLNMKRGMELRRKLPNWEDKALFSDEFIELSRARVKAICVEFPGMAQFWEKLSFEVE
jgi:hypothetical protein